MKDKPTMQRLKMWRKCTVYVTILCCHLLTVVNCQKELENVDRHQPCDNAIGLPRDNICLVPIRTESTWLEASASCNNLGGSLYESPDAYIGSRPGLMKCLTAMGDSRYDNMWISALGKWSPHFIWINGTWVNKVDYCSHQQPSQDASITPISSNTLSVDYCVSTCHDIGARFIVLHNANTYPECYCKHELPQQFQLPCLSETVDFSNKDVFYIVHSKEDSLIRVSSADAFTRSEILCATVDSKTMVERQIRSDTCFTKNQFICCLGEADRCVNTNCFGEVCRFIMGVKCMLRVSVYHSWYAARAYCVNLGGDLWNMHEFNEMGQVNQYLKDGSAYWIGATNYGWTFNGTTDDFRNLPFNDNVRVRCGLMFRETDASSRTSWQWSDADCVQKKSFLCQFNKTDFKHNETESEVTCPWPMPVEPTANTIITATTGANFTYFGNYTEAPYTDLEGGIYDGESFPIAAVIAAIIAGLILLTCLGLAFTWCSRGHMMAGRFRGVRERLAFIPYFANIPLAADYEGHAGMSSVSDHGSQVGLVKGEYQSAMSGYAMSSSYAEQSGMFASNSKSMDRRQQENMDSRLAKSQNYMASGSSSAAEREFAAASGTISASTRDYMTLQAQMSILDDAEVAALRESFRRKPEVALVTDNVDMNFTVNHAVSQGQTLAGTSAELGRSSADLHGLSAELGRSYTERTVEGIILPVTEGGITLNLPDRVMDEARIYSTLKTTYNV